MNKGTATQRRRGRVPGPKTDRYQVLLSPELAEWGKQQPGGLSEFLRRLLEDAHEETLLLPEDGIAPNAGSAPLRNQPRRLLGYTIPRALHHIADAVEESRKLLELKDDWDGEGGSGYSGSTWERAARFLLKNALHLWQQSHLALPAPAIYPGPGGSIDILWESEKATLLINILPEAGQSAKWFGSLVDGSETTKGVMDASETNLRLLSWLAELIPVGNNRNQSTVQPKVSR